MYQSKRLQHWTKHLLRSSKIPFVAKPEINRAGKRITASSSRMQQPGRPSNLAK
uniref:Uncharacterized protein n=1 Tax=Arundo donax TaxID=35708 RepID=A0A0A9B1K2_ARUDO